MNSTDLRAEYPSPWSQALRWPTCALAVAAWAFVGYFVPNDREKFIAVAREFGIELPSYTHFMFNLPSIVYPAAAILFGATSLLITVTKRSPSVAIAWNLLFVLLAVLALFAHRESGYQMFLKIHFGALGM